MNDAEKLDAAMSVLRKLLTGDRAWAHFEKWPEGDGWLQVDTNADLTVNEVVVLGGVLPPQRSAGPGGLPADWDDTNS